MGEHPTVLCGLNSNFEYLATSVKTVSNTYLYAFNPDKIIDAIMVSIEP